MTVRRLEPGDEYRLQQVCRRFKERVPSDDEAARLLAQDDVHVWVVETEDEPAGFAYAYLLSRIDGDASVFLYEVEVGERFRGHGLGRALVDEARALAERVGAAKMWVETSYDNAAARALYAAAGAAPSDEATLLYTWRFVESRA